MCVFCFGSVDDQSCDFVHVRHAFVIAFCHFDFCRMVSDALHCQFVRRKRSICDAYVCNVLFLNDCLHPLFDVPHRNCLAVVTHQPG